jgi:hypothetical protein
MNYRRVVVIMAVKATAELKAVLIEIRRDYDNELMLLFETHHGKLHKFTYNIGKLLIRHESSSHSGSN